MSLFEIKYPWTRFERAVPVNTVTGQPSPQESGVEWFGNGRYTVAVRRIKNTDPGGPDLVHLSIHDHERTTRHDWRDLQRIKNELVGPECEAIEIYPAESRKVDTSNEYHLWVVDDPTFRWPIGFDDGRLVLDVDDERPDVGPGWKQRALDPSEKGTK